LRVQSIFVGFTVPPSIEDIEAIAKAVLDDLPDGLHKYIGKGKLEILVEDFPDTFIAQEMELDLEEPFDLLGCYQSSPSASIGHMAMNTKHQDVLHLYRRPILDVWAETGENLTDVINRVIIQEIGHHFGFSPNEIEMYEEGDMSGATAPRISAG